MYVGAPDVQITPFGSVGTTIIDYNFLQVDSKYISIFGSKTDIFKHHKEDDPGRCDRMWRLFMTLIGVYWRPRCADNAQLICRGRGYIIMSS